MSRFNIQLNPPERFDLTLVQRQGPTGIFDVSGISSDAGNIAVIGSDNKLFVPSTDLSNYLTIALAADTYVPRTGGAYSGNVTIPALFVGAVDGPRLDRSGGTIRARSNDGLSDAPFSAGSVFLADGTNANPSFTFINDPDTGLARLGNGILGWSIDGSNRQRWDTAEVRYGSGMALSWSSATAPSAAASDVRLSRNAAGILQIGTTANNALGSLNLANLTASGTIQASQDVDSRHVFGRAVIQSFVTDNLYVSHFDHMSATNYALRQQPAGGTVLNSASGQLLQLAIGNITTVSMNDSQFVIGNNPAVHSSIFGFNSTTLSNPVNGGRGVCIFGNNTVSDAAHVGISGGTFTATSANNILLLVNNTFAPASGTANYFAVRIAPGINQTGGASGITRGIAIEPSLTSAADWRSFDTNVNSGFAYHSSGSAPSRFGGALTVENDASNLVGLTISTLTAVNNKSLSVRFMRTNADFLAMMAASYRNGTTSSRINLEFYTSGDSSNPPMTVRGSANSSAVALSSGYQLVWTDTTNSSTGTVNLGIQRAGDGVMLFMANNEFRFQNLGATSWTPIRCGNITTEGNIITNTTTGTRIGTATNQLIGFWGASPVVQPTTATANATFNSPGGGNAIKTDDTFDGYTIQQVVRALRTLGLLA